MSSKDDKIRKNGFKIKHDDHHGYIYNNKLKCEHPTKKKLVKHTLNHEYEECNKDYDHDKNHNHDHNENMKIFHIDHYDYIVNYYNESSGITSHKLHHFHNGHCDDHGHLERLFDEIEVIQEKITFRRHWRFFTMMFLTASFFLVELIVGIIVGSLALQADALHMLSDLLAQIIAFYSLK